MLIINYCFDQRSKIALLRQGQDDAPSYCYKNSTQGQNLCLGEILFSHCEVSVTTASDSIMLYKETAEMTAHRNQ